MKEKILRLSRGRPILIDLAVDWLARDLFLDWFKDMDVEWLKSLPDGEVEAYEEHFEKSLVQQIEQVRKPLDRLILAMARIQPVDAELTSDLPQISMQEVEYQIKQARGFSFVKSLPDGKIKLHDYMQEMVLKYVWPNMQSNRKVQDSERAVRFLERKLDWIESELLKAQGSKDFIRREQLDRFFWQLCIQRLKHQLIVEPQKGSQVFYELFSRATRSTGCTIAICC